ncbi:MAG: FAD-binding oxidoreductase [Candidatus Heimdallarchaeota archaeon]|nr:FAD-binding oxidoreductase [Candidatus Heimdallarchaeota archaeon]
MVKYYESVGTEYTDYLTDESGIVADGNADRIFFPTSESEVTEIILNSNNDKIPVTISGGGTGISGGRVPREGWIIATDQMNSITTKNSENWKDPETGLEYQLYLEKIDDKSGLLTVPISITVESIQNFVKEKGWFYPPDPTERTSFIGGNVATNASGARSFKFAPTRSWVQRLNVVLPTGEMIKLDRIKNNGHIKSSEITVDVDGVKISVMRPRYKNPDVSKNVAGIVIKDDYHPIDLFIGGNGIFGVVTEITLRLIRPPMQITSIFVYCKKMDQALDLIEICQKQRMSRQFPVPMSVEYMDKRAVTIMRSKDERIPKVAGGLVILEQDTASNDELEDALEFWSDIFDELEIVDTNVAQTYTEIEHHKYLRHWVPENVIALSKSYNQALQVTDYSVPSNRFRELFDYCIQMGMEFERSQVTTKLGYVFFAHAGDSHVHLTLLPSNDEEALFGNKILIKIMTKIMNMGGTIAAEHGLGKKSFNNKPALYLQYGEDGLADIRIMKKTFDPNLILNPENLLGKV